MFTVNSKKVEITYFPDGTCGIFNFPLDFIKQNYLGVPSADTYTKIEWKYESDKEYIQLKYIVDHIRSINNQAIIYLYCLYFPNSRMDRTKSDNEVFTLKYFTDFINSLKFASVFVLDPHSDVSVALINNIKKLDVDKYLTSSLNEIIKIEDVKPEDVIIFFPDAGAYKRYKDSKAFTNNKKLYGNKVRDWKSGKILGLKVLNEDGLEVENNIKEPYLNNKIVLMIDDIISYGGTLAYSADKLKQLGAKSIYGYASHVENSIDNEEKGTLLKRLNEETVKLIYTTNSLYSGKNEKIIILKDNS